MMNKSTHKYAFYHQQDVGPRQRNLRPILRQEIHIFSRCKVYAIFIALGILHDISGGRLLILCSGTCKSRTCMIYIENQVSNSCSQFEISISKLTKDKKFYNIVSMVEAE